MQVMEKRFDIPKRVSKKVNGITADTEIRVLYPAIRRQLAKTLDINEGWRKLAEVLTDLDIEGTPLYTNEQITRFSASQVSPTLSLFLDWETRGKIRPTVSILIANLAKAELYREAEYLKIDVLKGRRLDRPEYGLAAEPNLGEYTDYTKPSSAVTIDTLPTLLPKLSLNNDTLPTICGIPLVSYNELQAATMDFHNNKKLGQGGFGAVYLGHLMINNKEQVVAVKKVTMRGDETLVERLFQTELQTMARYNHENLLQVLAASCENPQAKCLVCAYMSNGTLEQRLAKKNGSKALPWDVRLNIAVGTARGLVELHTKFESIVHRDIKSANILLDDNFTAKIGDFGTAHLGSDCDASTRQDTKQWIGSPIYMPDEALRCSVTIKLDTYSYGVVLFEILTGLPAYINAEKGTLLDYIEEEESRSALEWKDPEAGAWPDHVVERMFACALRCVEKEKKLRPRMTQVLEDLSSISATPACIF